jgi:hypothetical protein
MTTTTPQRIIELWPTLSEEARKALTDIAESATNQPPLELTAEEAAALQRSQQDFTAGRTLSFEEMRAATDAFLAGLRARA